VLCPFLPAGSEAAVLVGVWAPAQQQGADGVLFFATASHVYTVSPAVVPLPACRVRSSYSAWHVRSCATARC
jgi:hypothetical protein